VIKVTMKHAAIGSIQMEFDTYAELFEKAAFLSAIPEKCDKCGADVALMYRNVTAQTGPRKGTKMKYYGLQCVGAIRHEYYLGIHNDDSRELFAYADRKFQDPFTNDQLQEAESKEKCPHCKTTNQFHSPKCPNYVAQAETAQEAAVKAEIKNTDNQPQKEVSGLSVAPGGHSEASGDRSAVPAPPVTPLKAARDRFVRSVGALGLKMGNTELAKMLCKLNGLDRIPSPITVEHWITCYKICEEYKVAVEIGGYDLTADATHQMLMVSNQSSQAKNVEDYDFNEWYAAIARAKA